jgi:ABC-type Zn2+ transport system substrate-binding protein/surface adhesin
MVHFGLKEKTKHKHKHKNKYNCHLRTRPFRSLLF